MLKTLTARAIVPVILTVTGFVAVCCILLYSNMKSDRIEENMLHASDIAGVVVKSTRYAMLKDDRETLRNIVSNVGEERLVEHVRIFNKQGRIVFSSQGAEVGREVDKQAEGCVACHGDGQVAETLGPMEQARRFVTEGGQHVLAITAAIYSGPECAGDPCHYHPAGQKVLGTLDLGLSEEPLQRNLGVMQGRLSVFGFLVLVLSVGGVATLLRMNVVGPIRELADYVGSLASGGNSSAPPSSLEEIDQVARACRELRQRLDRAEAKGRGTDP